ncbi:MAG: NAD(P)H-dependent oxidoreductase [Treponema sp.]|jgi:multimeric flavodoxin WrbA|nr:NAD(P)H-dependent oxidoreductase [Treponema sp.]
MKTVIIYGVEHKGSTYNAVQLLKNKLKINENDLVEFFLPKNMPHFCIGCNNCFMKGEELCPHQEYITPIKNAIWNAELIVLASPVYVFHVTGQMKALLDHFGFQFMVHRPNKSMFSKTALVVSTAGGGGMRTAINDMTLSLKYWGVSKIFTLGYAVYAAKWEDVTEKRRRKIEQKIENLSRRILLKLNKVKPSLKTKIMFAFFRMTQKKFGNPYDRDYWKKHGWLDKNRPWKNS